MKSRDPQILCPSRQKSAEAIDFGFLTPVITATSFIVVVLALLGQIELLIAAIVTVSVGLAWWALRLQEQSPDGATRFRELRRFARLRKAHNEDSRGSGKPSPAVVFGIAAVVGAFCALNLTSSWKQFRATNLPMVQGKITRHELVDVDLGSKLEVEYDYQVAGRLYHGNRLRFVYRAYRVGTDDAKKLAATWRLGNNVSVFCDPDSPADAVLDNTFCKGDELQAGLNAIAVIVSMLVMIGAACVQLQSRKTEAVVESSDGKSIIRLSNLPLIGTLAMFLAAGSLMLTFFALIVGLIAMGDAEIPWLVNTIDCFYLVTGILFCIAGAVYTIERVSFGKQGRELVIDKFRKTISWPPETTGERTVVDFRRLQSLRVASNRDDWFRLGRTFSMVAAYADHSGELHGKVIQRSYGRRYAFALATAIKSIIAAETRGGPVTEERLESHRADLTRSVNSFGSVVSAQQEVSSE